MIVTDRKRIAQYVHIFFPGRLFNDINFSKNNAYHATLAHESFLCIIRINARVNQVPKKVNQCLQCFVIKRSEFFFNVSSSKVNFWNQFCAVRSLTVFSLNALQMFRAAVALMSSLNSYNRQARLSFEMTGIVT